MNKLKLVLVVALAFWMSGCAVVCFHYPEDYDMCFCHYYDGGLHK